MPQTYIARAERTNRFTGTCRACMRPVSATVAPAPAGDRLVIRCPDCGQAVKAERIYGTTSRMECAPLCESAAGPSCECACGGVNHGGAWERQGEALASQIAAWRKREAERAAEREQRREAARTAERAERDAWASEHPELAAYLAAGDVAGTWPLFLDDMARIARREPLTPRQAAAAERIMREQQQRAAERETARPAPSGTVTVAGEIVSVRTEPSRFSRGVERRMLVKAAEGWRVWVTVPSGIMPRTYNGELAAAGYGLPGKHVTFTAELSPKRDDPAFAYGKRPRAAKILEPAA